MKQRITVEQLMELTEEQRANLRKWWQPQLFDVITTMDEDTTSFHETNTFCVTSIEDGLLIDVRFDAILFKEDSLPLLSTGQCIDYLGDILISLKLDTCGWVIESKGMITRKCDSCGTEEKFECTDERSYYEEPIDALWELIKENK